MPLTLVAADVAVGGDPSNGIAGGGGLIVDLPAATLPGDLCVVTLCKAHLNDVGGVFTDGRDWRGFQIIPDGAELPKTNAVACVLDEDLRPLDIVFGGGPVFGFLDEGYGISIYRGVKRIVGADIGDPIAWDGVTPATFGLPDLAHTPFEQRAAIGAIGTRVNGFVNGFPSADISGEWDTGNLVFPGFHALRTVSWVADPDTYPRGLFWQEYAPDPGGPYIPPGEFFPDGSAPDYAVGVLYLELYDDVAVTRQYPRDDGYGLIGGPRVYPPQRQGRVFGGQQ